MVAKFRTAEWHRARSTGVAKAAGDERVGDAVGSGLSFAAGWTGTKSGS